MTAARFGRAAWAFWLIGFGLATIALWLDIAVQSQNFPYHEAPPLRSVVVGFFFYLTNTTVGALVIARQPRNAVGWLFLLVSYGAAVGDILLSAALYGTYVSPGSVPAIGFVSRVSVWVGSLSLVTIPYLMLLFPAGRFLSRGWRRFGLVLALVPFLFVLGFFSPVTDYPDFPAPLPIPGFDVFWNTAWVALLLGTLLSGVGAVVRFRRSRGVERLQMKWMALAGGLISLSVLSLLSGGFFVFLVALLLLPIACGIAILRYRLYDIDLLMKRTLVYGATTATIAATFWIGILTLQGILSAVTSGSDLTIAASTLVSLALFQPVRRRVQNAVDQRFDRSRYDAARTLDAFADLLRDEVDLDALRAHLLGAVQGTMAPAHASLWLRERGR